MALDLSVLQQLHPVQAPPNPLETMAHVVGLKNAMLQGADIQSQTAQRQAEAAQQQFSTRQAMEGMNVIGQHIAGGGSLGDDELVSKLAAVNPSMATTLQTHTAGLKKTKAETEKATAETEEARQKTKIGPPPIAVGGSLYNQLLGKFETPPTTPSQEADIQARWAAAQKDRAEADKLKSELAVMPQSLTEANRKIDAIFPPTDPKFFTQNASYKQQIAAGTFSPTGVQRIIEKAADEAKGTRQAIATAIAEQPLQIQRAVTQALATANALQGNDPRLTNVPPSQHKDVLDKVQKVEDAHTAAQADTDTLNTFINLAKAGNKEAYAYSPVAGVLEINTGAGIKRINRYEIEAYGGAGSLFDAIQARVGKLVSGASISPDVLKDMQALHSALGANTDTTYQRSLQSIDRTYRSNFAGSAAPQPASAPTGTRPRAGDGKGHFVEWDGKAWVPVK